MLRLIRQTNALFSKFIWKFQFFLFFLFANYYNTYIVLYQQALSHKFFDFFLTGLSAIAAPSASTLQNLCTFLVRVPALGAAMAVSNSSTRARGQEKIKKFV